MKQTKTKLLCLILTALMLLSGLTACGKDKEGQDSNLIKLGDMSCSTRARASWKIRTETTQSF